MTHTNDKDFHRDGTGNPGPLTVISPQPRQPFFCLAKS